MSIVDKMKKECLSALVNNQNEIENSIYKAKKVMHQYEEHYKHGKRGESGESDIEETRLAIQKPESAGGSPKRRTVQYARPTATEEEPKRGKPKEKQYIRPETAN